MHADIGAAVDRKDAVAAYLRRSASNSSTNETSLASKLDVLSN